MQGSPKNSFSKFAVNSEGQGVAQFLPNENAVILKNGRRVEYDQLVIATGLREVSDVKGLNESWEDPLHQFHTCQDHPGWKSNVTKPYRFIHNFHGGEAIYYIPPSPFHGEI